MINDEELVYEALMDGLAKMHRCDITELGDEWVNYAEAVAGVAATRIANDKKALGRLVIAAVGLP